MKTREPSRIQILFRFVLPLVCLLATCPDSRAEGIASSGISGVLLGNTSLAKISGKGEPQNLPMAVRGSQPGVVLWDEIQKGGGSLKIQSGAAQNTQHTFISAAQ